MAFILNLETSTEICSVAIGASGQLLCLEEIQEPYQHASQITLLIQLCLSQAGIEMSQLSAVAVSIGPGSFTGLRIGASVAKGIVYALDKPLIAVDTLQALAFGSRQESKEKILYVPMIDARRMEVYTAIYDEQLRNIKPPHALILTENVFDPWLEKEYRLILSGNGAAKAKTLFSQNNILLQPSQSSAANMVSLSYHAFEQDLLTDPAYFKPLYLKPPNITKPKKVF